MALIGPMVTAAKTFKECGRSMDGRWAGGRTTELACNTSSPISLKAQVS